MNDAFADYMPQTWFEEAGVMRSSPLRSSATYAKRMRRWRNTAKGLSMSLATSAAIALASLSFGETASAATNALDVPPPNGIVVAPPPGADASVGEVNESFAQLFAAFRTGAKLITNEQTRNLAKEAAARRNVRPEGWARKVAKDTGEADD